MSEGNGTPAADPKIGRTLELAREERGLSLHQAEQETKIRARYLKEFERENFDVLPPVYVQGSLKTYANYLGLDGDSLTRELKRRQPAGDDPSEAPTRIEPPRSDYLDRYLASVGAAAAADDYQPADEDEELAATAVLPAKDGSRLYLASVALFVLAIGALALALVLPQDGRLAVSEVREPMISQAPSEVAPSSIGENETANRQEPTANDDPPTKQKTGAPDTDNKANEDYGEPAQDQPDSTAAPSSAPPVETASTQPTPAPAANEQAPTQPAPAPSEAPVRVAQAPAGGLQAGGPVEQRNQGPVKGFSITRGRASVGGPATNGLVGGEGGLRIGGDG